MRFNLKSQKQKTSRWESGGFLLLALHNICFVVQLEYMVENFNKNIIPIAILVAGVFIAGTFIYLNKGGSGLSSQAAAEKAIDFINQTIQEDVTASLIGITEESGLYKVKLKIEETEYDSYITKDGKLLFPNAFNLEGQEEVINQEGQTGDVPVE